MLSLTATELPRFMACNGSRLMGGFTPLNPDNTVAEEGNAAHWLIEQAFKGISNPERLIDKQAPNNVFITDSMVEFCEPYLRDIQALGGAVEVDTSYSTQAWEIRGRCDHAAQYQNTLVINDFKFGWRIVEPENHWTLIWHAIGWMIRNPAIYINQIIFTIYQPRPYHPMGNIRKWIITREQLDQLWIELQNTLLNPSDMCCTSMHCAHCPAITQCPAKQMADMNSIDVAQKAFDSHVNNQQLSFMLDETARAIKMLEQSHKAYEELAEARIKSGATIPEYSMQNDLGQNQWKDGLTPEIMKSITGIDISKKQLVTPNQAKKMGVSEEVIKPLTERNNKGFKLVRVDELKKAEKLLGKPN